MVQGPPASFMGLSGSSLLGIGAHHATSRAVLIDSDQLWSLTSFSPAGPSYLSPFLPGLESFLGGSLLLVAAPCSDRESRIYTPELVLVGWQSREPCPALSARLLVPDP